MELYGYYFARLEIVCTFALSKMFTTDYCPFTLLILIY